MAAKKKDASDILPCRQCGSRKEKHDFGDDGIVYRIDRGLCPLCYEENLKKQAAKEREAEIAAMPDVSVCAGCGATSDELVPGTDLCVMCAPAHFEAEEKNLLMTPVDDTRKFARVLIGSIKTGRNVRKDFDPEKHKALIESIRINGILEPLLVMHGKKSGEFILLAGERRLKAAIILGMSEVPCFIYPELNEQQLYEIMLSENLLRDDLNPVEEAYGLQKMLDLGMTQEDLGARIGKSQEFISNRLRLLTGPDVLRDLIISREITPSHALVMMPWTPYPVFDSFIKSYIENYNKDHKKHYDGAIIPVKEIHAKFHSFRDCYLEGNQKTKLTLDIHASFGENGGDVRAECIKCSKALRISGTLMCLDADCIKIQRKKARDISAAKRGKPVSGSNPGKKMIEFRSSDDYDSDRHVLRQSDCKGCEKIVKANGDIYCSDEACYTKKNADKKIEVEARSKEIRTVIDSAILEILETTEERTLLNYALHCWFVSEKNKFTDRNGLAVFIFGETKPEATPEEILDVMTAHYLRKSSGVNWSYEIMTDKRVKEFMELLGTHGIECPKPLSDLVSKPAKGKKKKGTSTTAIPLEEAAADGIEEAAAEEDPEDIEGCEV